MKVIAMIDADRKEKLDVISSFFAEHNEHMKHSGVETAAWWGLQWDACPDFIHVKCLGCGDVLRYQKHDSLPEIIHSDVMSIAE